MAIDGEMPPGFPREKTSRVWVCKRGYSTCTKAKPCRACIGFRSQSSGRRKQRDAQKALEVVTGRKVARFRGSMANEENWTELALRVEVKSGAQVGPIWTRYAAAEAQADAAHAIGNPKPFALIAMGQRTSDGLFVCRLSQLGRVVEALVDQA